MTTSSAKQGPLKVAIVHDWLVNQRGGENVLDAICELFPRAELFTLVYTPGVCSENIIRLKRHVSPLQKIPGATKRYRHMLPIMPWAIEHFDFSGFDLIISSSHCVAKGIRKPKDGFHLSYVYAPMRYMWDRFDEYFNPQRSGLITRMGARTFRPYLKAWDRKSASQVDHFVTLSNFIAAKIKEYYNRPSEVVYPFCDEFYFQRPRKAGNYYFMVSALVPYKRVDLAIQAFNKMKKELIIVGDGPERERLTRLAGPTVQLLGALRRSSLADLYSKCKAFVFPGVEDFGITPLEAMASGAPVIGFGEGGLLETVTEKTGVFFNEPTVDSLIDAVNRLEKTQFSEEACRAQARLFNRARFQREFVDQIRRFAPARIGSSLEIPGSVLPPV